MPYGVVLISCVGLVALLLPSAYVKAQTIRLEKHSVIAGSHDFNPGHGLQFDSASDDEFFELSFRFDQDAWFDPSAAGPIQRDGQDWNKLGGVSYLNYFQPSSWPKNVCAALIGWRPHASGAFEWCLYVNRADGSFVFSEPQLVQANEQITVKVDILEGEILAKPIDRDKSFTPMRIKASILGSLRVNVGPWFGGNRPSPRNMTLWTRLRLADEVTKKSN